MEKTINPFDITPLEAYAQLHDEKKSTSALLLCHMKTFVR